MLGTISLYVVDLLKGTRQVERSRSKTVPQKLPVATDDDIERSELEREQEAFLWGMYPVY